MTQGDDTPKIDPETHIRSQIGGLVEIRPRIRWPVRTQGHAKVGGWHQLHELKLTEPNYVGGTNRMPYFGGWHQIESPLIRWVALNE